MTALILQIKAFGADSTSTSTSTSATTSTSSTSTVPLQFQLDSANVALTSANRAEQLDLLDSLATTLESTLIEIDENLVALEPQMLEKQRLYQEIVTENDRLLRDQDVATETYLALARKVDEERILAQDNSGGVRLASGAAVPVQPAGSGLLLNVVVAGVVGLGLGLGIALILAWWRGSRSGEYQVERERLNARTT
jgi:uncharacterized protein involved in exopolysaccharide biosynthesis